MASPAKLAERARRAQYIGEPRHWQIMVRPKWIFALVLTMAVACGFAALAQWQLGNAVRGDDVTALESEKPVAVTDLVPVGGAFTDAAAGHMASVSGGFVDDWVTVVNRQNQGQQGVWVVGRFVQGVGDGAVNYPTAIGWAKDTETAKNAIEKLHKSAENKQQNLIGRLNPTESKRYPKPEQDPLAVSSIIPGQFVNLWRVPLTGHTFQGFIVLHADNALLQETGLSQIDSVAPQPPEKVNLLNMFYAIEWVVFAGFAFFFWWRLTRDAWEREHEERLQKLESEGK